MPKKVDANQRSIVQELRARGMSVQHLHEVGKGCPDILVGVSRVGKDRVLLENYLFEIKDPAKPPSATRLTKDETRWHSCWLGQVSVVYSVQDILAVIYGEDEQGNKA